MAAAGMDVFKVVSLLVMVLCLVTSSHGYEFVVGGEEGWVENPQESYDHWAARIKFQVHDTLVFKYEKEAESVLEVKKKHYVQCNTSNPIKTYSNGDSKVELSRSGAFYFISGQKSSCENGQKLYIDVLDDKSDTPASSPSPHPHPPTVSPVSPTPISHSPSQSPKSKTPSPSPSPESQEWTPTPGSPKAQPPSPSPSQAPVVSPPSPPSNSPSPSPSPSNSPSPSPQLPPSPPSPPTSPSPSSDDSGSESDSPAPSPEKSSAHVITSSTVLAIGISVFLGVTLGLF